jgi:hypothetical protein
MFSVRIDKDGDGYVFKVQPSEGSIEMVALDSAPGIVAFVRATNEGHACHVAWEKALRIHDTHPKSLGHEVDLLRALLESR